MMMMIRRFLPFIFAASLGLIAVGLMQRYLQQQRRQLDALRIKLLADYQAPIEVLVAKQDLPEGKTLELQDLGTSAIPKKFIQPYAAFAPQEVVGLVTVVPMAEGEQVLRNKLRRPSDVMAATLSGLTPKGKRAVTIGTDVLTGVGGFIRPGDTIDVLWTFQVPQAGKKGSEFVTLTLFQNVSVVAVGNQMMGRATGEQEPNKDYTVTLALTPQEASLLLFAREQGRIDLSLRPRQEPTTEAAAPPVNMATLLASLLGEEFVGDLPRQPRTVEVIKGLERHIVVLEERAGP